jgi:hypothetical protein
MLHYRPTDKQDAPWQIEENGLTIVPFLGVDEVCLPARLPSCDVILVSWLTASSHKDTDRPCKHKGCNGIRQQEWRHVLQYGRLQTVLLQTNVAFVATDSVAIFASSTFFKHLYHFQKLRSKTNLQIQGRAHQLSVSHTEVSESAMKPQQTASLLSKNKLLYLTFRGPCIVIYSYNESQRDALFLKFIW